MTVGETISVVAVRLREAGIDSARLDAEVLMAHALGTSRLALMPRLERELPDAATAPLAVFFARRAAREPVALIVRSKGFWRHDFTVAAGTLVPRPDSETLIEAVLDILQEEGRLEEALNIVDLGVGSGCLLLSLLAELPKATGLGLDKDRNALHVAAQNAAALGVADRARFVESDWWTALDPVERFDLVVANPPYVESAALNGLEPEVRDFEPRSALDGGVDGLEAYRAILSGLAPHLKPDAIVALEVGQGQADAVADMLKPFVNAPVRQYSDLGGVPRVVLGACATAREKRVGMANQNG